MSSPSRTVSIKQEPEDHLKQEPEDHLKQEPEDHMDLSKFQALYNLLFRHLADALHPEQLKVSKVNTFIKCIETV